MSQAIVSTPPVTFRPVEINILSSRGRQHTYDWARRHLRMIDGPLRGHLWDPDTTPQGRGVMDAFDDPAVRKIYAIAPSQSGKTTICFACFFSALATRSDNWGIGMPDEKSATAAFQGKLHKYFEQVPALRRMVKKSPSALQAVEIVLADDSRVSAMYPGSEGSMRSKSMPYLLVDEPDAYNDPSAVGVMQERADAYHAMEMSKIILACRPKGTEEQSVTWTDAKAQAQAWMQYAARCPACHTLQFMEHENLTAVDGTHDPRRIRQHRLGRYRCAACRYLWNDGMRNQAIRRGQWVNLKAGGGPAEGGRPNDYGTATVIAYHTRSWESTLVSLSDVLADWFEAQGNPRRLQLFDNNRCAKPYRFVAVEQDWETLRRFCADGLEGRPFLDQGVAPDWTLALTVAVDMQMDHFFWSVAAHGLLGLDGDAERTSGRLHVLDYGQARSWRDLAEVVFASRYRTENGRDLAPWRGSLDTGGGRRGPAEDSRTLQAYLWLMAQRPGVIQGTKGMSRQSPGVQVDPRNRDKLPDGRKAKAGFHLYFIDTDFFKRTVFWSLSDGCDEEPVTFHARTTDDYLRQIASERLIQTKNGQEEWRAFRANHYLDCMVGHKAMAHWQWKPGLAQLAAALRQRRTGILPDEAAGGPAADPAAPLSLFTGESLFGGGS